VSVWIPPGGIELTEEEEALLGPMLVDLVGSRASEILTLFERLEETHPNKPPHYYLSLLGTHPDHRGKGLGMGLLAENLARIDSEGMPRIWSRAIQQTSLATSARASWESVSSYGPMGS
jgi:GNAT superfamily N-acetyltransferase